MADTYRTTRRAILVAAAMGANSRAVRALTNDADADNVGGETVVLDEALNVAGGLWIGPDSDRSNVEATSGRVYLAIDTEREYYGDGGDWIARGFSGPVVRADELSATYSIRISSASELDDLDSNISQGDVVAVEQPATPYRTTSWMTIDTPGVTLAFESRWAKDGQPIVKPADGADVGGIRVGTGTSTIEDVEISGFGFHGNQATMTDSEKRLHGIVVENARNVTVRDCFVTQTHPYHEHNSGGSGITVRKDAENVTIEGVFVDDIGDRGIQLAGDLLSVSNVTSTNGYDRAISLDVTQPDESRYFARSVEVSDVTAGDHGNGSIVGCGTGGETPPRTDRGNYSITGVVARGSFRNLVNIQADVRNIAIAGNTGQTTSRLDRSGIVLKNPRNDQGTVVSNNSLHNFARNGIEISVVDDFAVTGNVVRDCGGDGIHATGSHGTITANYVHGVGGDGVYSSSGATIVAGNVAVQAGENGYNLQPVEFDSALVGNLSRSSNQNGSGSDEFHVADSGVLVTGNKVSARNGTHSFDDTGGNNEFWGNMGPTDGRLYSVPETTLVNGEILESANAESPQGSYPPGTTVRFTDTGDDSGTGTYLVARDGTTIQIASNS